jgi:hypothetical protein
MNIKNVFSGILFVYIVQSIMSRPIQTLIIATGSFYIGRVVDHPSLDYAEEKITEKIEELKESIGKFEKKEDKEDKPEGKSFYETAANNIVVTISNINPWKKDE